MFIGRICSLVIAAVFAATAVGFAQEERIQLEAVKGKISIRKDTPLKEVLIASKLSIECGAGVDCRKLQVKEKDGAAVIQSAEEIDNTPASLDRSERSYDLSDAGPSIQIVYDGMQLASATIKTDGRQTSSAPLSCAPRPNEIGPTYYRKANLAVFWVSHLGNIWAHPREQVDEDDDVLIIVRAPEDLLPRIRVKRTSATRVVGGINIIGEGLFKQALETRAVRCGELRVTLSDFAPGAGQVQIALHAEGTDVTTGTFEFSVAALYDGYLSYAGFYTDATPRTFKLGPSAAGTIILPGEVQAPGDRDIRFAVSYTHFVWGKREVVKGPEEWYHRVNPSFGVTTSELAEHFLFGVSIDLGGFTVGSGLHTARQTILHPQSELTIGSVFTGKAEDIPTAKDWTNKGYVAIGVDLRAVVAMFKAAVGVGKFGQ